MLERLETTSLIPSKRLPSLAWWMLNANGFSPLFAWEVDQRHASLWQNFTVSRKLVCDITQCSRTMWTQRIVFVLDFLKQDVSRMYKDLIPFVTISLVEAGPALLGPFDRALQNYAYGLFKNRDIDVKLGTAVVGIEEFQGDGYRYPGRRAMLSNGTHLEFGTMVWSAGLSPVKFTQELDMPRHTRNGRILVDEFLRVRGHEGSIWAIGDAANAVDESGGSLPQLAQVARQQGIYLGKIFNGEQKEDEQPFRFFSLGSMASLGDMKGVYDGSSVGEPGKEMKQPMMKGLVALLLWRFAYWGRQTSLVNKILIPMHWMKSFIFGRGKSICFSKNVDLVRHQSIPLLFGT